MPPRTIDNLGPDVSERYAKDQETLKDISYIKGAHAIPSRTEIDVSASFFPSELETLLQAQPTHVSWAYFIAPLAYHEQRKRLFTHQITPTINTEGSWEARAQKVLDTLESLLAKELDKDKTLQSKKILTGLISTIDFLNRLMIEINCKKSQYQKG